MDKNVGVALDFSFKTGLGGTRIPWKKKVVMGTNRKRWEVKIRLRGEVKSAILTKAGRGDIRVVVSHHK